MDMEENAAFVINNAGAYHTTCIELEVTALAVNTIIEVTDVSSILYLFQVCLIHN